MRKFSVTHKNVTYEVAVEEAGGPEHLRVMVDGVEHRVDVVVEESEARRGAPAPPPRARPRPVAPGATAGQITAPLPGNILKVLVKEGDPVRRDTVVCVLEAMKMETQIQADREGRVAEVLVKPGDKVEGGQLLVRLEAE